MARAKTKPAQQPTDYENMNVCITVSNPQGADVEVNLRYNRVETDYIELRQGSDSVIMSRECLNALVCALTIGNGCLDELTGNLQ